MFHFLHLFGDCCTCKSLLLFITLWDRHGMSQALFEQGPLNHWLHRVPFQRCHQLSSWALPSRGIAQPARGPTRPRTSALDSSRRSNQLRPAAESNAALGFGHCCNIRRLAQRRSAAWRCIDMYSCIYIYIYILYIYILIYAKCFSMAAKCLKDLKVIYVMEVF